MRERISIPIMLRIIKEPKASPMNINNCAHAGLVFRYIIVSYSRFYVVNLQVYLPKVKVFITAGRLKCNH